MGAFYSEKYRPNYLGEFFLKKRLVTLTLTSPFCSPCRNIFQHYLIMSMSNQGCQMVCFQTKNPNLGQVRRALEWKMLLYFMSIWNIFGHLE
jgi:hypothetical protein